MASSWQSDFKLVPRHWWRWCSPSASPNDCSDLTGGWCQPFHGGNTYAEKECQMGKTHQPSDFDTFICVRAATNTHLYHILFVFLDWGKLCLFVYGALANLWDLFRHAFELGLDLYFNDFGSASEPWCQLRHSYHPWLLGSQLYNAILLHKGLCILVQGLCVAETVTQTSERWILVDIECHSPGHHACKHQKRQGGSQRDRPTRVACWRWPHGCKRKGFAIHAPIHQSRAAHDI